MSIVAKVLKDGLLTATITDTQYTAPTLTRAFVKQCSVMNSTAGVVTLVVKAKLNSGGTFRTIITQNLAVNQTYPCFELINLGVEPGGVIEWSGLNLELYCTGLEVST